MTGRYMITRLFVLLSLLCAISNAQAQDAAPTTPETPAPQDTQKDVSGPDPRNITVAQDIVKSFDMKTMLQGVLGAMTKAMVPLIAQSNPGQNDKIQKIVIDAVQKSMLAHMDEMEKNKATVYAQMFSYDELIQLRDFYASPVGQKMIKATPEMMSRSLALDQNIMRTTMRETNQRVIDQLKKNGMQVPKELGV